MKKLFVMTLALATLVSCSKDETIESGHKAQIGFGKAFVDNATRAELTGANILDFKVWGTEAGAAIFDGTEVSRTDVSATEWSYTGTKYWHPGNSYKFAAIAPATYTGNVTVGNDFLPTSTSYTLATGNIADQIDLLYATQSAQTSNPLTDMDDVAFTFSHMLSKVQFTFTNGHAANSNYNVLVKDVIIEAKATATVTLASGAWTDPTGDVELSFLTFNSGEKFAPAASGVSDDQSLIIPNTNVEYTVAGIAEIYVGDTKVEERAISGTIPVNSFESGKFYNVTATIASNNEIKFTVKTVTGWGNSNDVAIQ